MNMISFELYLLKTISFTANAISVEPILQALFNLFISKLSLLNDVQVYFFFSLNLTPHIYLGKNDPNVNIIRRSYQ